MKRLLAMVVVLVVVMVAGGTASAHSRLKLKVEADLDGGQEVLAVVTEMTGEIGVEIKNNRLKFELKVEDNSHDISAAHLHCAPPGVNGPVGITLFSGSFTDTKGKVAKGRISAPDQGNGCGWSDLADVATAIQSGGVYANVHTTEASGGVPSGEIRGNLPGDDTRPNPLTQAVEAIGGQDALNELERLEITSTGATWIDFESPQPGGLMETSTYARTYTFDLPDEKLRIDVDRQTLFEAFQFSPPQSYSMVLGENVGGITAGAGVLVPAGNIPSQAVASVGKQQRLFNPHFLLQEALLRPGLAGDGGTVDVDGRSHRILTLADDIAEIRLFVEADTGLISKLETIENHARVRDTSLEVRYGDWQERDSLLFPTTVELYFGGLLVHEETRSAVESDPSFPDDHFDLPPEADPTAFDAEAFAFGEQTHHIVEAFFNTGFDFYDPQPGLAPPAELAPGVALLASGANTLVIGHDNGLVVLEAPFSPAHGTDVVDAIGQQFPGDPITHVIPSHHHMDHTSGVRSLVAAGATAVVGNGVGDLWNDVLSAESTIRPDALAGSGPTGVVQELDFEGSFVIADDDITTTVQHISTIHADDMVITIIETGGQRFVYEADLYNAGFGGTIVVGGPEAFFAALRDLDIIDQSCSSALPLTIVPAHGVPQTLQDSLAELEGRGVDVGC